MGDVVRLHEPTNGEQGFIACPCGTEAGWNVVAISDAQGPIIAALVCVECEREIPISFGRLVD